MPRKTAELIAGSAYTTDEDEEVEHDSRLHAKLGEALNLVGAGPKVETNIAGLDEILVVLRQCYDERT